MVEAAAAQGWINREPAIDETLISIRRAGADVILSYWALEWAQLDRTRMSRDGRTSAARPCSQRRPRPSDPGWGQLAGPRLPGRRRHAALHRPGRGPVPLRPRRQRAGRPGLLLGSDAARPRASRGARGGRRRRPRAAPRTVRPTVAEVDLAAAIVDRTPVEQVRLVNSGTEATMSVLRLARGITGRDKIIKFAGCYHGHVDALLAAAGSGVATLAHPPGSRSPERHPSARASPRDAADTIVCQYNDRAAVREASRPTATRSPRDHRGRRRATWASSRPGSRTASASTPSWPTSPTRTARCSSPTR